MIIKNEAYWRLQLQLMYFMLDIVHILFRKSIKYKIVKNGTQRLTLLVHNWIVHA